MKKILLSSVAAVVCGFSFADEQAIVEATGGDVFAAETQTMVADHSGMFAGVGVTFVSDKFTTKVSDTTDGSASYKKRQGLFGGVVQLGYAKVLQNNFYVGADLNLEFTQTKKRELVLKDDTAAKPAADGIASKVAAGYDLVDDKAKGTADAKKMKQGGFSGDFGIRIGYSVPSASTVVYVRPAARYVHNAAFHKVTPMIGLGVDKKVCGKWGVGLECDYVFRANKNKDIKVGDANYKRKFRSEGMVVRLVCSRSI